MEELKKQIEIHKDKLNKTIINLKKETDTNKMMNINNEIKPFQHHF